MKIYTTIHDLASDIAEQLGLDYRNVIATLSESSLRICAGWYGVPWNPTPNTPTRIAMATDADRVIKRLTRWAASRTKVGYDVRTIQEAISVIAAQQAALQQQPQQGDRHAGTR